MKRVLKTRLTVRGLNRALCLGVLAAAAWTVSAQPKIKPAQPGSWPGFRRGDAQSLRVVGNRAYLGLSHGGLSGGLTVVDISDAAKPFPVGGCDASGVAVNLDVANGYAYLAGHSGGLEVFDVRDSTKPVRVGSCGLGGPAADVQVVSNRAYVAVTGVGLVALDLSDPAHPLQVATNPMAGRVQRLHVASDRVYMALTDRLEIVRVTDATNLTHAGTLNGSASDVDVAGRYAFLTGESALKVVDVGNPALPVLVSSNYLAWGPSTIKVVGDYAYVGCTWGATRVLDVRDPVHPVESGWVITGEFTDDVEVVGHYAYVTASESGLHVIDVNVPAVPVRVGGYAASGTARYVQVSGHHAFLADNGAGLQVLDVSNPATPVWVGDYFKGDVITGLQLLDQYAVVSGWGGLDILDVSLPARPEVVGRYVTNEMMMGFQVIGPYAYVACDGGGLRVIDVSTRTNPFCVGVGKLPDYGYVIAVRVEDSRAYVAIDRDVEVDQGVFDVSDPARPVFLGTYEGSYIWDMAVVGRYRLVADSTPILKVYDISEPTNAVLAATFRTADLVYGMTVAGDYAYLSEGSAGVQVIDVSNPTNILAVGMFDTGGRWSPYAIVADKIVYLTVARDGLLILPSAPNVQLTLQVEANPGEPFTIEAATDLALPDAWTPLLRTNSPRMPFSFTDSKVKGGAKFYRVRQP